MSCFLKPCAQRKGTCYADARTGRVSAAGPMQGVHDQTSRVHRDKPGVGEIAVVSQSDNSAGLPAARSNYGSVNGVGYPHGVGPVAPDSTHDYRKGLRAVEAQSTRHEWGTDLRDAIQQGSEVGLGLLRVERFQGRQLRRNWRRHMGWWGLYCWRWCDSDRGRGCGLFGWYWRRRTRWRVCGLLGCVGLRRTCWSCGTLRRAHWG